jgi:hypothetical protein
MTIGGWGNPAMILHSRLVVKTAGSEWEQVGGW